MKQTQRALIKLPRWNEGRHFFGYTTQNWHWFTCTRCSSVFQLLQIKCSDTNLMPCKNSWIIRFPSWLSVVYTTAFRQQPRNWEQLRQLLCFAFSKIRWWILMFLAAVVLSCKEISSSSSNSVFSLTKQAHDGSVVRTDYKLVLFRFNSRSD